MSFHEKNAWACVISLLLVFIPYFFYVLQNPVAYVWLFILAVVLLVGLLVIFHIVNSSVTAVDSDSLETQQLDERDQAIEVRASKWAGIVLGFVVVIWCLNTMIGIPIIGSRNIADNSLATSDMLRESSISVATALTAIHLLFAGFVFANVVYYFAIIFGYRRAS